MNVTDYYKKLNDSSQAIFHESLKASDLLSKAHNAAHEFGEISETFTDLELKPMFRAICSQFDLSCLSLSLGLYRPSAAALRLTLELGLGSIYFSANKVEHREWVQSKGDIKWSVVNDPQNGALSPRFVSAFFPELGCHSKDFYEQAASCYRALSEQVHGNNNTWSKSGLALQTDAQFRLFFEKHLVSISTILKFAIACRYLNSTSEQDKDAVQDFFLELNYIDPIRQCFGGPKGII
jgi:hypothetical protein